MKIVPILVATLAVGANATDKHSFKDFATTVVSTGAGLAGGAATFMLVMSNPASAGVAGISMLGGAVSAIAAGGITNSVLTFIIGSEESVQPHIPTTITINPIKQQDVSPLPENKLTEAAAVVALATNYVAKHIDVEDLIRSVAENTLGVNPIVDSRLSTSLLEFVQQMDVIPAPGTPDEYTQTWLAENTPETPGTDISTGKKGDSLLFEHELIPNEAFLFVYTYAVPGNVIANSIIVNYESAKILRNLNIPRIVIHGLTQQAQLGIDYLTHDLLSHRWLDPDDFGQYDLTNPAIREQHQVALLHSYEKHAIPPSIIIPRRLNPLPIVEGHKFALKILGNDTHIPKELIKFSLESLNPSQSIMLTVQPFVAAIMVLGLMRQGMFDINSNPEWLTYLKNYFPLLIKDSEYSRIKPFLITYFNRRGVTLCDERQPNYSKAVVDSRELEQIIQDHPIERQISIREFARTHNLMDMLSFLLFLFNDPTRQSSSLPADVLNLYEKLISNKGTCDELKKFILDHRIFVVEDDDDEEFLLQAHPSDQEEQIVYGQAPAPAPALAPAAPAAPAPAPAAPAAPALAPAQASSPVQDEEIVLSPQRVPSTPKPTIDVPLVYSAPTITQLQTTLNQKKMSEIVNLILSEPS